MPELPEVETIRRGVEPYVTGRRIERIVVRDARLRWPVPSLDDFVGQQILSVERRAKYLIFGLESGDRLLIHLGMSGRLFVLDPGHPLLKHDHVDIELSAAGGVSNLLRYHDPRRFGAVLPWRAGELSHSLLADLGPEPFSDEFSGEYLFEKSRGKSVAVKNFIMDGHVVVGAGNIYAAEALFRAKVLPSRAAGKVSRAHYARLAATIREVLGEAIVQGGTTLRDFRGSHGESGYFQQDLYVYGLEGQPCRICTTAIRRAIIGQRSSFYCPGCQQ